MYAQSTSGGVRLVLESVERRLLDDLLAELASTLDAASPSQDDDPFAWWERQEHGAADPGSDDPAVRRLFPMVASAEVDPTGELRSFARTVMSQQRASDLAVVRDALSSPGRGGRLDVRADDVDAWLRILNAINLLLTSRLGIIDVISADEVARAASDDDHPVAFMYHVHQWVAGVMESILDVMHG